ncbi:hypothetical protein I317_05857 [Kwoniella heveanensis CBS 569]|uniref:Uncharacterized protein n=1 Tax=Kwoniella heveanensis BCC8398 TaxID=1296120 RepID=A0A1B9H0W9_9TREE|nr:hypothetical protein I316_01520 [Kwoniella heveanensis BCC8398]OCF40355.1 hypothetical protein I317_05857 [Kwoniella heveanensis CBS 569]
MKKLPPSPSPSIFSVPDSDQGGSQSDDDYREPSSSPDPVHRRSSIKRKRGSVSATTANAGAMTSQLKSTKTKKSETITSNKTGARRGQSQSGANKTLTDRTKVENDALVVDIEDSAVGPSTSIQRAHGIDYHFVDRIGMAQEDLLSWFEVVREKRGMPWRKRYDPSLSMEEKGQRAYEVS